MASKKRPRKVLVFIAVIFAAIIIWFISQQVILSKYSNTKPQGLRNSPASIELVQNKMSDEIKKYLAEETTSFFDKKKPNHKICNYILLGTVDTKDMILGYIGYRCDSFEKNGDAYLTSGGPAILFIDKSNSKIIHFNDPYYEPFNREEYEKTMTEFFPSDISKRLLTHEGGSELPSYLLRKNESAADKHYGKTASDPYEASNIYALKTEYTSGSDLYNSGAKINLPEGWSVKTKYEDFDDEGYKRITVELLPPSVTLPKGTSSWGGFFIDVYPKKSSITEWINTHLKDYKDGLTIQERQIGNKIAYLLKTDGSKPWSKGWVARTVILGDKNSYVIGGFQDGQDASAIYPNIIFE